MKCWPAYSYLKREASQVKKFCKCAQGSYSYRGYSYTSGWKNSQYYLDSGNNENWATGISSQYKPIYQVKCSDNNIYPLNKDYYKMIVTTTTLTTTTSTTTSTTTTTPTITTTSTITTIITSTTTTTTLPKCWSAYPYLQRNSNQMNKFCKCAQGIYSYRSYSYSSGSKNAQYYLDSGNNENWATKISSNYKPVYQVRCYDNLWYQVNKDYYRG